MIVVMVAAAGAAGAVCRFLIETALRRRRSYPIGTLVVNVSGSLLLGLVAGLVTGGMLGESWSDIAGAGFLGGYTTFSAAAVEAVRLAGVRRTRAAAVASVGMLVLSVLAAATGLAAGRAIAG